MKYNTGVVFFCDMSSTTYIDEGVKYATTDSEIYFNSECSSTLYYTGCYTTSFTTTPSQDYALGIVRWTDNSLFIDEKNYKKFFYEHCLEEGYWPLK